MKKLLLFILIFGLGLTAQAQDDEVQKQLDELQKVLQTLQELRKADSLTILHLQDSVRSSSKDFEKINLDLERVKSRADALTTKMAMTAKGNYDIIENNMLNGADLFIELNRRINTLDALNQAQSYQSVITQLNNPTDASMGFSFQDKVKELLTQHIKPRKSADKSKLLNYANALLQSPIVQGIPAVAPVVSIGTQLVSFVASFSAKDKNIDSEDLIKFKNELGGYTMYYTKLNEANTGFQVNTKDFNVLISNLQNNLKDFVLLNAKEVAFETPEQKEGESSGDYLNRIFRIYNSRNIQSYLDRLKTHHAGVRGVDYEKMLSNTKLEIMNSRIEDVISMYKEFYNLYTRYLIMLETHNEETVKVMQLAIQLKLSQDDKKAQDMIDKLNKNSKESINRIKTSINIFELEELAKSLVRK